MSSVGERIKKLRKEKKLTLAQVAQDKMSAAMVSLIENGKSKPSAENLEHIAKVLDVEITDLLGGVSREELRSEITRIKEIISTRLDLDSLLDVIQQIQTLFPNLSHNVESARIYSMYAYCLHTLFLLYKEEFDKIQDNDRILHYNKALDIYEDLQMESKALGIKVSLAIIEHGKGNYHRTIEMVEESLQTVKSVDSFDTINSMINLKMLRIYSLAALGKVDEIYKLLDEVIAFSNKHMMLNEFYMIHNVGAMLYYQENDYEEARKYVDKINKFFEIIKNDNMLIDKEMTMIHYMEFFEDKPIKALEMIENFEKEIPSFKPYSEVLNKRIVDTLSDLKARCYTKINEPHKALPLFKDLMETYNGEIHPLDVGLRVVSKSYQALCSMQLGEKEKAIQLAKEGVSGLKEYPHSAYYHFAVNVLRDAQQMK
ncbi:helix-turn-helix transcriptional regulator [Ornithinibacillus halotolerans]|uniref:Transcriptional regulator n=1 Tax=Ornithinibacillus halotolerans TaxID=1274357 RepID=A0A916W8Y3_9BACI|nr:helix-turn-helix transcriptional regulator [Ornithinibacillus halotolerans]GGA77953.1 transcriptional regulator [Ornithinibacillus halotolerans]